MNSNSGDLIRAHVEGNNVPSPTYAAALPAISEIPQKKLTKCQSVAGRYALCSPKNMGVNEPLSGELDRSTIRATEAPRRMRYFARVSSMPDRSRHESVT